MNRVRTAATASMIWGFLAGVALGQSESPEGVFTLLKSVPPAVDAMRANVRPGVYQAAAVDWNALRAWLDTAPMEDTPDARVRPLVFSLPTPDGTFARFAVVNSPVMEPGLAAQFPEIQTFLAQGIDDPAATARLDYTPHGFHAQVLSPNGTYYIDPWSFGDTSTVSYYKSRYVRDTGWRCFTTDEDAPPAQSDGGGGGGGYQPRAVTRSNFRLAVSCTGEYAVYHGGTVALAQAAITTAVNRVTGIYEIDLLTRLTLVANNTNVVFINAATDPYANDSSTADRNQCHTQCVNLIGSANFDIGHVFETGGGGVATIGSVCSSTSKGRGLSGFPAPINDPFTVDYVAHEMGHQFNGRHCFNSCGGGPGDSYAYAYEPGSGSTIMAYAGICGSDDLQPHSDAMFHSGSLDLMRTFAASTATCRTTTALSNSNPTVSAGSNATIPKSTPFILTATASDPDGNALTYSWEERDTGTTADPLPSNDLGANPIVRARPPSTSPSRMVPPLANVLAGNTAATGEILPTTSRTMNFRVVVRDNVAGAGGVATSDMTITVDGNSGPFQVTSPNSNVAWSGVRTVTWNVAGTSGAPVNCANVKISLSTDGGNSFPTVLLASTPNTGSASVTLPNLTTSSARIKVEAVGNIFFDVSNTNFSISPSTTVAFSGTGVNVLTDTAPNGNGNGRADPGESALSLIVQMVNSGGATATGVTGTLTSLTPTASIVSGVSAYANMPTGSPQSNTTPFVLGVDPSHACGSPVNLRLTLNSAQGSGTYDFSISTGAPGAPVAFPAAYTTPVVAIPDNTPAGVNIPISVSGFTGNTSLVTFRFDGSACSAADGATTVGLDHTYLGDLIAMLTSPTGQVCTLFDRPGVPATTYGNDGNNLCNTEFRDSASTPLENAVNTQSPFTGAWLPASPLSVFNGTNPNGTWVLNVSDNAGADTGSVRAFTLTITAPRSVTCDPPAAECDPDYNQDGNADQDDVIYLINVIGGGDNPTGRDPDFTGDGNADQDDVVALINAVGGGGCP
jgi:subtilisin-like proprotein convertase family protein